MTPEPQQRTSPASFYRPELDGLRFIAFLAVFVSHAAPSDWTYYQTLGLPRVLAIAAQRSLGSGGNGVPLFFILSSYLITTLLLREHERFGAINVRDFYVRRSLRIWPLYFTFILGVFLFAPPDAGMMPKALPLYLLFAANWSFLWPAQTVAGVAGVLWSVSVEEQFYALWPLLLKRVNGAVLARAGVAMIAFGWVVRALMEARGASLSALWLNTFAWLDSIGAGALLALLFYRRLPQLKTWMRVLMIISGPVLWAFDACIYVRGVPYMLLAVGNLAGCALMLCGTLGGSLLTSRPLVFLGRISYGLYVFHVAALYVSGRLFDDLPRRALMGLALTIASATLSYYALELPFLKLKKRFTRVRSRE